METKPGEIRYHKKLGIKVKYLGTLDHVWYDVSVKMIPPAVHKMYDITKTTGEIPQWEWHKHWTTDDPKLSSEEILRSVKIMKLLWRLDKIPDKYSVYYLQRRT